MNFRPYQHVERLETPKVEGLLAGQCYVFPKLDGSNGSVWLEEGKIYAGSRKRVLTLDHDNAGFAQYIQDHKPQFDLFFIDHPQWRLFGEWLVRHTIDYYREYQTFYVFDVKDENNHFVPYHVYQPLLAKYRLPYIPCQAIIENPTMDQLQKEAEQARFLIPSTCPKPGEGIVVKNYNFRNKFDQAIWGKLVLAEFKAQHGTPTAARTHEEKIVAEYVTNSLIDKEFAKLRVAKGGCWHQRWTGDLLNQVFDTLLREESYHFLRSRKGMTLRMKTLHRLCNEKVKLRLWVLVDNENPNNQDQEAKET